MPSFSNIYPTIPVTDLGRAKSFYMDVLGLAPVEEDEAGIVFKNSDEHNLYVYKRGPSKADHTLAGFRVDNLSATIDEMVKKGAQFEHYDMPGLKTDDKGVAVMGHVKAAWFKDPDGNILGITEHA